jgi:hypothetical protein
MDDHAEPVYATAESIDFEAHVRTYRNFVSLVKGVVVVVAVILILLAYFLV